MASVLQKALPAVTGLACRGLPMPAAWTGACWPSRSALSILTGVVFGIVPALRAASSDLAQDLASGTRASETRGGMRLRGALVISQVFISFALLVGSGLLIRSFIRMNAINPGFDTESLLTGEIMIPRGRFPMPARERGFLKRCARTSPRCRGSRQLDSSTISPSGMPATTWPSGPRIALPNPPPTGRWRFNVPSCRVTSKRCAFRSWPEGTSPETIQRLRPRSWWRASSWPVLSSRERTHSGRP